MVVVITMFRWRAFRWRLVEWCDDGVLMACVSTEVGGVV